MRVYVPSSALLRYIGNATSEGTKKIFTGVMRIHTSQRSELSWPATITTTQWRIIKTVKHSSWNIACVDQERNEAGLLCIHCNDVLRDAEVWEHSNHLANKLSQIIRTINW